MPFKENHPVDPCFHRTEEETDSDRCSNFPHSYELTKIRTHVSRISHHSPSPGSALPSAPRVFVNARKPLISSGTCRAPARSRRWHRASPRQKASPRSRRGHQGPGTSGDPGAHLSCRATLGTREPSPASHPRRPAARAAPEPPGGLLPSRREAAPAARELAGSSEKTLPSSLGTSSKQLGPRGKAQGARPRGERQRTQHPESGERSGEAGTEAFDRSFPLMGEVLFTPNLHCFQRI